MIDIDKAKKKYNELLEREKKACLYLNNKSISLEIIIDKYIPAYQEITRQLSLLMKVIPGITEDEILNGFKLQERKSENDSRRC